MIFASIPNVLYFFPLARLLEVSYPRMAAIHSWVLLQGGRKPMMWCDRR